MPSFGVDIGGTLVKVVYFQPEDASREEINTLRRLQKYVRSSKEYVDAGQRDAHLEMSNCSLNNRVGTLHFMRFPTCLIPGFLELAGGLGFDSIESVYATGGGACKFEDTIKIKLGITLRKSDELESLVHGIHYIDKYNTKNECYFFDNPLDSARCTKVRFNFSQPYPYLVVNIGSGVSILAVYSATSYDRVGGSSIGGGTFVGLCSLLAGCDNFDDAIELAKAGTSQNIHKLVRDIYGGDYPKFNLSGDTVASCFGHMHIPKRRMLVDRQDLARASLEMITINIGSIARMCATNKGIDRIVFVGSFLRVNELSMKLLSYSVDFWSKGRMKALFLEHVGYFGAVGCFINPNNEKM